MHLPKADLAGHGSRFSCQITAVQGEAASPTGQVKRLPELAGAACGVSPDRVAPVQSLWNLLYQTLKLLDDLEDGDFDPGGWPIAQGTTNPTAVGLNFATGLLARLGRELALLSTCGISPEAVREIQLAFYETLEGMCAGQHDDLAWRQPDLKTCWSIARAKSGLWFGLGSWVGGRIGTDDPARLEALRRYGVQLGLLVQIKDDAGDLWGDEKSRSDLVEYERWTLPVAYAMSVLDKQQRAQLQDLLKASATDPVAEAEARQIVIDSGAALFITVKARTARYAALEALEIFSDREEARSALTALVESLDFSPL